MVRTLAMNETDARMYMAGTSLTRFIGFESIEDFCRNTVLAIGDIETDEMLYFSNSIDRDVKNLEQEHTKSFSDYFVHSVAAYVAPEYLPQADLFFSLAHLRHCYEQGILNDSLSYPCYVLDDTVYIRASFELEFDEERGHVIASVVLIDVTRFHAERQALATASTRDTLTGAINRMTAHDTVAEYIKEHLDGPAGLAIVNIDSFRQINDRFGHEYGDRTLMNFVDDMRSTFSREVTVSRTSGDEFLLFFPDTARADVEAAIAAFAERAHDAFPYQDRMQKISVSAGYAMYPEDDFTYDDLVADAREAMQMAKADVQLHHMAYDSELITKRREGAGLSLRELANNVPGAIFVYRAYGEEEILFANKELIDIFECDSLDDLMTLTDGTFQGIVHPDDMTRVNREIWSQIKGTDRANKDYVEFRIITKNGQIKHVEDWGRLVDSETYGKVFFVVLHEDSWRELGA